MKITDSAIWDFENLNKEDQNWFRSQIIAQKEILELTLEKFNDQLNLQERRKRYSITDTHQDVSAYKHSLLKSYPSTVLNSAFIYGFSFLEYRLNFICARINFLLNLNLSTDELNGKNKLSVNSNINKSLRYLELFTTFDKSRISKLNKVLSHYVFIRNKFSHEGGHYSFTRPYDQFKGDANFDWIEKEEGLEVTDFRLIKFTNKMAIYNFLDFTQNYYISVVENLSIKVDL